MLAVKLLRTSDYSTFNEWYLLSIMEQYFVILLFVMFFFSMHFILAKTLACCSDIQSRHT